jgi:gametolysin peptidase M11
MAGSGVGIPLHEGRFYLPKNGSRLIGAIALTAAIWGLSSNSLDAQGPPPDVGRPVAIEGDLDVIYEDAEPDGRLLYFLDTPASRLPVRFQGSGPDLPSGTRVRLVGNLADDRTLTATEVKVLDPSTQATIGPKRVLVILFNFSNNTTTPFTKSTAESVNDQVRDFYLENSYQQTTMTFTVTGWHRIAATDATCSYSSWADQADAAASAAGFNVSAYDRRVYAFPRVSACSWKGMGNVGGPRSWLNGTYTTRVVAHEQGHNFGNLHSHARKCDSSGCQLVEYGNDRDVLGKPGVVGHMNAFQKERLGWLNSGESPIVQTVTASNDYWIDNYATLEGHTKGLRIWSASTGTYLYVESREHLGFDVNVPAGVTLHTGSPTDRDSSYQIDLAPATTTWDSTLDVGQSVTHTATGVTLTALSSSIAGALVRVEFGSALCSAAAPGVSLSPSSQSGAAATPLKYTITVTNRSGSGCAASLFTASAAAPSGWTSSFSPAASVLLAPGASGSLTLSLVSPTTASGVYSFSVAVTDGTSGLKSTASGSANIGGEVYLTATISASVSSNGNSRSAEITVAARNGSHAVSGVAVTVTVTTPVGRISKLSAMTNSSGTALVKYSAKWRDPSGIYRAQALVSMDSASTVAATTFILP